MSLEFLGGFDNADTEEPLEDSEATENTDYTAENRRHLKRLEEDFLNDLATGYFVKDWLQTIMFNSFNVFISLYCIHVGVGLFFSVIAGFSIGSIPALKNIGDNVKINIENESRSMSGNGNVLKGLVKLVLAGSLTFSAVSEWKNVTWMAQESHKMFMEQMDAYENPGKHTFGLDPDVAWLLATGVGFASAIALMKFMQRREY
jgi:hypothetical protein